MSICLTSIYFIFFKYYLTQKRVIKPYFLINWFESWYHSWFKYSYSWFMMKRFFCNFFLNQNDGLYIVYGINSHCSFTRSLSSCYQSRSILEIVTCRCYWSSWPSNVDINMQRGNQVLQWFGTVIDVDPAENSGVALDWLK